MLSWKSSCLSRRATLEWISSRKRLTIRANARKIKRCRAIPISRKLKVLSLGRKGECPSLGLKVQFCRGKTWASWNIWGTPPNSEIWAIMTPVKSIVCLKRATWRLLNSENWKWRYGWAPPSKVKGWKISTISKNLRGRRTWNRIGVTNCRSEEQETQMMRILIAFLQPFVSFFPKFWNV